MQVNLVWAQIFKMCNQIMVGTHIQSMCEAFALCKSKGGDLKLLKDTLIGGAANSWLLRKFRRSSDRKK